LSATTTNAENSECTELSEGDQHLAALVDIPPTDEELIVEPDFQSLERQSFHDQLNPHRRFTTLCLDDMASGHMLSVRASYMKDQRR
jgi:hypothetical protein